MTEREAAIQQNREYIETKLSHLQVTQSRLSLPLPVTFGELLEWIESDRDYGHYRG